MRLVSVTLNCDGYSDEKKQEIYTKYRNTVNMSYSQLKAWSETEYSKKASLDRSPIRRNLELLSTKKEKWTNKHYEWANKTIAFVSRMKKMSRGKDVSKDVPYSKRDISLRNWAFNPS